MTTATRSPKTRKPARKPQRSASITTMTHGKLCLWIHEDGEVKNGYVLTPLASDFGTAYRLGKATIEGCSDDYDVLLNGNEASCTCPGHNYRNKCKHVDALLALIAAGKLPPLTQPEAPKPEAKPKAPDCPKCGRDEHLCACYGIPDFDDP